MHKRRHSFFTMQVFVCLFLTIGFYWFPQKALHGFHTTLIDESGRVESKDFISDYRNGFSFMRQVRIPI